MCSFSISFAPRGLSNPKVTLVLPGKDPKIEPKVRYYQPPVRTVKHLRDSCFLKFFGYQKLNSSDYIDLLTFPRSLLVPGLKVEFFGKD